MLLPTFPSRCGSDTHRQRKIVPCDPVPEGTLPSPCTVRVVNFHHPDSGRRMSKNSRCPSWGGSPAARWHRSNRRVPSEASDDGKVIDGVHTQTRSLLLIPIDDDVGGAPSRWG